MARFFRGVLMRDVIDDHMSLHRRERLSDGATDPRDPPVTTATWPASSMPALTRRREALSSTTLTWRSMRLAGTEHFSRSNLDDRFHSHSHQGLYTASCQRTGAVT